jgi:hypothetical protein
MAYTTTQFQCPNETHSFLPSHDRGMESMLLQIFRSGWVCGNVYRPYFSLYALDAMEQAGYLEIVEAPSTYRLTDHALAKLHRAYGV